VNSIERHRRRTSRDPGRSPKRPNLSRSTRPPGPSDMARAPRMLISSSRQMPPIDAMRNARHFAPRVKQTPPKCQPTPALTLRQLVFAHNSLKESRRVVSDILYRTEPKPCPSAFTLATPLCRLRGEQDDKRFLLRSTPPPRRVLPYAPPASLCRRQCVNSPTPDPVPSRRPTEM
jgi:hypothetical protein